MAGSTEHLIDSDPPSDQRTAAGSLALDRAGGHRRATELRAEGPGHIVITPCQMVEALAGDCRSSLGERLRRVDLACGFGRSCSSGCDHRHAAASGFVGDAATRLACVGAATSADMASNNSGF